MNRVENILEPDLIDWDAGNLDELNEDEFIDLIQTFLEDDLDDFLEDDLDDFLEDEIEDPVSAEGNIICADELCLISAD